MISLAKDSQAPRLGRSTIFILRLVLAAVWLFWGVRDGVFLQELGAGTRADGLATSLGVNPQVFSLILGALCCLMALWLISGWAHHFAALVQIVLLLFLWWVAHAEAGPFFRRIVEHAPMFALIVMVFFFGPGTCVWSKGRQRGQTWTRG